MTFDMMPSPVGSNEISPLAEGIADAAKPPLTEAGAEQHGGGINRASNLDLVYFRLSTANRRLMRQGESATEPAISLHLES